MELKIREIIERAVTDPDYADTLRSLVDNAINGGIGSAANEEFARIFLHDENDLHQLLASPAFSETHEGMQATWWKTTLLSTPACTTATTTTTTQTLK